ncbi:MAG: trimeric autotransporter adhesin [Acidobacteriota bacterium]|jgi:hypothetical protein|nr:trimeric autotransporter adhesin [Acidobacteriota bacterium]
MFTFSRTLTGFLFALLICLPVCAQTAQPIDAVPAQKPPQTQASIIIAATANNQRVRYAALGEVNQTRVQVFAADGSLLFDSDYRLGNLVDWQLVNQQGQALADGSYLFLISVKDFSGNLTQKYGTAQLAQGAITLQQTSRDELPTGQATSLSANQLASTLSTIDRVGAGAASDDLSTAATTKKSTSKPGQTTNISGTGTQNQVAKWIDNAGTLGDSAITETSGNVGIGTTSPAALLHIQGSTETVRQTLSNTSSFIQFAFFEGATKKGAFGYQGSSSSGLVGGPGAMVFGTITGSPVAFFTNGTERVRIDSSGNFGIGTTSPSAKLDVSGAVNATQYNVSGVPMILTSNSGTGNTFTGSGAGASNGSGQYNAFYGTNAGNANTTGNYNSFIGANAGSSNTAGNYNSFVGYQAGNANTTANYNAFFGYQAGFSNTTGENNSFVGYGAGNANTTGGRNSFVGYNAGLSNTTGISNSFVGYGAGSSNTTGSYNSFFGEVAGVFNSTASYNSIFGYQAGTNNTTGENNSFFGTDAGLSNSTGSNNSFFGFEAGISNMSGSNNTALGFTAGTNITTGSNNIEIGNNGNSGDANTIRIGTQGTQASTFIAGISSTTVSGVNVLVTSSGQLGIASSSRIYKQDIQDMGNQSSRLMQLRPVTFRYKPEYLTDRSLQYGLIAEEVEQVYPELVQYSQDGKAQAVRYQMLNTMLLNEMQKQQRRIQEQEAQLQTQAQQLHSQAQQNAARSQQFQAQAQLNAAQSQQITELELRLRRLEAFMSRRQRARRR